MKQKFVDNLERALLEDFVLLCGGDPNLLPYILKHLPRNLPNTYGGGHQQGEGESL